MKLYEIAHSRTGDKGNLSTISLIPYEEENYERLKEEISAEKVKDWFSELGVTKVDRYQVDSLKALNFVLHNSLGGGVTKSLALDTHGKSLSSALLEMELD
ncbi:AtuA-related protein [Enterococcus sp. AZ109]|uniref:AtuA-related protein n=1 Tax=Enterococcus sp. AZ109 TaxID=2774634 RepID=UPI003F1F69FB